MPSRNYQRVVETIYGMPWSILPAKMRDILAFIHSKRGQYLVGDLDAAPPQPTASATPRHKTEVVDRAWDGPANEKNARSGESRSYYRRIFAWEDPDGDEGAKSSYRFIHHHVDSSGNPGAANVIGCRTGIGVINGARGGTTIPQADKRPTYEHLAGHLRDADIEPPEFKGELALMTDGSKRAERVQRAGGVAIVPIFGVIFPRANLFSEFSGGISCEVLGPTLNALVEDKTVDSILLDIDSPGGAASGVPEMAAEIRRLRSEKPIIAVANGLAASAAYWLASQASEVVVVPSGNVGSIGVYSIHEDHSEALKQEGVNITLVSAGKFKVEGHPFGPLEDDARAEMQKRADAFYKMFVDDVAAGRNVSRKKVLADFGQGRLVMAQEAKRAGMVDRVATINTTLARLLRRADRRSGRVRAEIETIRDFEALLRDEVGLSHTRAKVVAASGWKHDDSTRDGSEGDVQKAVRAIEEAATTLRALVKSNKGDENV